jgi:hypothetical protein
MEVTITAVEGDIQAVTTSGGGVAGIVAGIVAVLLLIAFIIWWCCFKSDGGEERAAAGAKAELERAEARRNTMDMETNPMAAARRARAAGKNTTANKPLVVSGRTTAPPLLNIDPKATALYQQHNYASIPDAVNRFPNPMYQSSATGGGGDNEATYYESEPVPTDNDVTYYESEPVPINDGYLAVAGSSGRSMPARAVKGDYSSYTVASAQAAGDHDYVEMSTMAGVQNASNNGAAPLNPEQTYAETPSGYVEASVYVPSNTV